MLGEEPWPGLRAWTTFHAEWDKDVRSFAIVEHERLTLIDPLIGGGGWDDLAATRGERALEILLTIHWHARSTAAIRERHPDVRPRAWSGDRAGSRSESRSTGPSRSARSCPAASSRSRLRRAKRSSSGTRRTRR